MAPTKGKGGDKPASGAKKEEKKKPASAPAAAASTAKPAASSSSKPAASSSAPKAASAKSASASASKPAAAKPAAATSAPKPAAKAGGDKKAAAKPKVAAKSSTAAKKPTTKTAAKPKTPAKAAAVKPKKNVPVKAQKGVSKAAKPAQTSAVQKALKIQKKVGPEQCNVNLNCNIEKGCQLKITVKDLNKNTNRLRCNEVYMVNYEENKKNIKKENDKVQSNDFLTLNSTIVRKRFSEEIVNLLLATSERLSPNSSNNVQPSVAPRIVIRENSNIPSYLPVTSTLIESVDNFETPIFPDITQ